MQQERLIRSHILLGCCRQIWYHLVSWFLAATRRGRGRRLNIGEGKMQLFLFFKLLFYCDVLVDIKNCFLFYLATGRTATCRLCTMVGKLGLSQAKRHHSIKPCSTFCVGNVLVFSCWRGVWRTAYGEQLPFLSMISWLSPICTTFLKTCSLTHCSLRLISYLQISTNMI